MNFSYSVIIPVFNEKYFLEKNIVSLRRLKPDAEIIIADGGSTDGSLEIAKQMCVRYIVSDKGRGKQLNKGAQIASGNILIFLHADTFLPVNAFQLIEEAFINPEIQIARFLLGFDFEHYLLNFYKKFSGLNSIFTRFGDSAVIMRKEFFRQLNGFDDAEVFEDVDLFRRASKYTDIKTLNAFVESSARKFISDGVLKRQFFNFLLFLAYFLNVDIQKLSNFYYHFPNVKKKQNGLIMFVRNPVAGKVKTRLAKTTSGEFAAWFYKICAENTVKKSGKLRNIHRFVFYSEKEDSEQIMRWLRGNFYFSPQEGENLGSRMLQAFQKVFSTGLKNVVIIGTDIPDITGEIIEEAFARLQYYDVVIGPSKDGGYYLLGMSKLISELFTGIVFSTATVYAETMQIVNNLNLKVFTLPVLEDIDTETDLQNWLAESNNVLREEINRKYSQIA